MKTKRSISHLLILLIASAGILFAGCSTKKVEVTPVTTSKPALVKPGAVVTPVKPSMVAHKPSTNAVYFAFDSSHIDAAARATLEGYAAWLNANAAEAITIEGNCDQRGSREYNLALGQQRADTVRAFMTSRGVSANRIDTVSFGEERPACKGSGEACWAQNRRGDIVSR